MLNKQMIAREINELEKLINAITVEMPKPQSSSTLNEKQVQLRAEMEAAIEQLRLARGLRLMLLNAYNMKAYRHVSRIAHDDQRAA
jgi:hypothetical protein